MRLIDADDLLVQYDKEHEGPPGRARELIENAPTVKDSVEVIRCKDCSYYVYNRIFDHKICNNILGINRCMLEENDYCSAAVRRTEAEDNG